MPGVSNLASVRGHEGTGTNQGSCIVYIAEKPVRKHALSTTFALFVEASKSYPLVFIYLSLCYGMPK